MLEQEEVEPPRTPTNVGFSVPTERKPTEQTISTSRQVMDTTAKSSSNALSVAPLVGAGRGRKVSGSAFRNVILPPSDMVTSELKRQQQPLSSSSPGKNTALSGGKGKEIEETMAKLGIRDQSAGAAVPLRTTPAPRKTLVPNNPSVLSGSTTTTAKQTSLGLGRPSSSSLTVPSSAVAVGAGGQPNKRIVSIGKTDGRVLGKHMPRVVSAQRRVVDDSLERQPEREVEEKARDTAVPVLASPRTTQPTEPVVQAPPTRPTARPSRVEEIRQGLIRKSLSLEREQGESVLAAGRDSSLSESSVGTRSRFEAQAANSTRPSWRDRSSRVNEPRADSALPASPFKKVVPDGRGMAGLTGKAVEAPLSPRPGLTRRQDSISSVTGYGSRLRLSRGLPLSSSSVNLSPAPLPSKRLNTNWMDKQRKALVAYEYLCHVGEAQQWIEGCLGEELGWGVVEMEEEMRDGVALAKLVRVYEGEQVVKTIWEVSCRVESLQCVMDVDIACGTFYRTRSTDLDNPTTSTTF
ncbi:hypothetical protein QFC22_002873 [Naganishia vaughanmartiniae]|uniref:Uncharacterized protein n=1 Tax=Naganishia vaughanmartiniae TaxID=1424756 RepID=A0ACC2XAI1_9TREE|nr:hypothetical protein QFC22_002873 [Naganishia vaughanmartiniae]